MNLKVIDNLLSELVIMSQTGKTSSLKLLSSPESCNMWRQKMKCYTLCLLEERERSKSKRAEWEWDGGQTSCAYSSILNGGLLPHSHPIGFWTC